MPVAELLARTTSAELGEWQAFERAYGPLGNSYMENMLAEVVDELARLRFTTISLQVSEEDMDAADVCEPIPVRRPADVVEHEDESPDEGDEDQVE